MNHNLNNNNNSPYEYQAFLSSIAEFLEKTISGTGFSRSSLVVEVIKNKNTTKKYAIIHEGVPSQRYVLNQEQMQNLIEFLKLATKQNTLN